MVKRAFNAIPVSVVSKKSHRVKSTKFAVRTARLSRCVRLLTTLQSRIGYSIENLALEFEVSERTIYRDLRLLAEAGMPTSYDANKRGHILAPGFHIRASCLSNDELVSLLLGAHIFSLSCDPEVSRPVHQAISKILTQIPSAFREDITSLLSSVKGKPVGASWPRGPRTIVTDILTALRQRQPIRIVYHPAKQATSAIHTKITAHHLVAAGEHWHLVGRSSWHRKVFRFDLRHIHSVQQVGEPPRGIGCHQSLIAAIADAHTNHR